MIMTRPAPPSSDSDRDGNYVHKTADKRESKRRKDETYEEYSADDDSSDCDQTNPSVSKQRRGDGTSQARLKKRKTAKKASKNSASSPTNSAAIALHVKYPNGTRFIKVRTRRDESCSLALCWDIFGSFSLHRFS
jgi:hypothetical protein